MRPGNAKLSPERVRKMRLERAKGRTLDSLAAAAGVHRTTVQAAVKGWSHAAVGADDPEQQKAIQRELEHVAKVQAARERLRKITPAVARDYTEKGLSTRAVAALHGLDSKTVCDLLSRAGVPRRTRTSLSPTAATALAERNAGIVRLYAEKGWTTKRIAARVGASRQTVRLVLREGGVKLGAGRPKKATPTEVGRR